MPLALVEMSLAHSYAYLRKSISEGDAMFLRPHMLLYVAIALFGCASGSSAPGSANQPATPTNVKVTTNNTLVTVTWDGPTNDYYCQESIIPTNKPDWQDFPPDWLPTCVKDSSDHYVHSYPDLHQPQRFRVQAVASDNNGKPDPKGSFERVDGMEAQKVSVSPTRVDPNGNSGDQRCIAHCQKNRTGRIK